MTMNNEIPLINLFEDASNPQLLVDGDARIIWRNQAANSFFEVLADDTDDLRQYLEPEKIKAILATEHYSTLDVEFITKSGTKLQQAVLVSDLSSGDPDSLAFLLSLFSSITEKAEINQRAQFLESVAHDLKNPLGAIFGYADALLDTAVGVGLNDIQQQVIGRVRSTALRCLEMVRNYQQLLELESHSVLPVNSDINLDTVISSVIAYLWRENKDGSKLNVTLSSKPLMIKARRAQIERVFANLLGNAIKYTPAGETINVKTEAVDEKAVISVHNSGVHIPAEELPGLFERYSRASTGENTSGTGLGLHIVNQITERLGGSIQVKSSPETGTVFTVALPLISDT